MDPSDRIFVALDTSDLYKALALAEGLRGLVGGVKLGQEFFTAQGPAGVDAVTALGLPVFLDLKFHDIPATVSRAVGAALALKLFMLNVHASGGEAMMWAAADAAGLAGDERPLVVAVTVLTSLWSGDLVATGIDDNIEDQVLRLAALAENCDLDGVVCSPREVAALRRERGPDFKLVVPGIRPTWAATDDQKRVETPADTVAAGADYLVIGRPITESQDPADAARRIADEIGK